MIELQFAALLSAIPAVESGTPGGVNPIVLDPNNRALPAIDYSIISTVAAPTFEGHGTQRTRVEVNVWANDYGDAVTLRYQIVQALDGYSGDGLTIRFFSNRDFFDSAARQYRAMVEFYLFSSI